MQNAVKRSIMRLTPSVIIRRRFKRGINNLIYLYMPICDSVLVFNNVKTPAKLIARTANQNEDIEIDWSGLDLSVRVKELYEFGGTSYWEYCEITDVQSTEISFTKKTDRQYSDMWGDFYRVSTFKIQYDKGKLHLIPIKRTLYKHCTSSRMIVEDESSMNNMLNIYLYKNDNW